MEIWLLPRSEVMGTNVVGEERNEPNHSPVLPTPEDGRDLMDIDLIAGLVDGISGGFNLLGGLFGGLFMKVAVVGGKLV